MSPVFLSHPSCERRVTRVDLIEDDDGGGGEARGRNGREEVVGVGGREGRERRYPERGQTSFQRPPVHTHPRYCDTAFMSVWPCGTQTQRISVWL